MTTSHLIFLCLYMKRLNKAVQVIFTLSMILFQQSIQQSVFWVVRASASLWKHREKWSITLCSGPLSLQLLEMKIGNHPSDQRQQLLPRVWIYDYNALTPFICIHPIQQCGLECATPPQKTAAQKILHKLSQILLMLSILLLLIPLHCLFISALSCMGNLDWFGFQGWQTGKLGG